MRPNQNSRQCSLQHPLDPPHFRVDRETPGPEELQYLKMAVRHAPGCFGAVCVKGQGAFCSHLRIQLAQAAGSRVAWINQFLAALPSCLLVPVIEPGQRHVDFSPDFEGGWPGQGLSRLLPPLLKMQWDGVDGADIQGYVLAGSTVTAGGGLHQAACFITQGNGDSVQLGFGDIADVTGFQSLDHAVVKLLDFLRRECIGQ